VRSQTCCLVYSDAAAASILSRVDQPDEYVAVLVSTPTQPAAQVTATAGHEQVSVADDAVIVVPPGDGELLVTSPGVIVRVFSNETGDLIARARNRDTHADVHPHTAPFAPWPAAPDGNHLACIAWPTRPLIRRGSATSTAAAP
jgi:hypothetical protein